MISKGIVASNVALRLICIKIMNYLSSNNETKLAYLITRSVFIVTFINMGLIVLLANANLTS